MSNTGVKGLQNGILTERYSVDYGIATDTICSTKRTSKEVFQHTEQEWTAGKKRFRTPINQELEAQLYSWVLQCEGAGDTLTDTMLRDKAIELNEELAGSTSFIASKAWIARFKERYGINIQEVVEENRDDNIIKQFVVNVQDFIKVCSVDPVNLYNMYESRLTWKSLPKKILAGGVEYLIDDKKLSKDKITIGLCSNATGTHKLPPLVVHKYACPKALKHCIDDLPVVYKAHRFTGIHSEVFMDWYQNDFKVSVKKHQLDNGINGAVVLIVNCCYVHTLPPKDNMFNIILVPPLATSVEPMNQGIIEETKRYFHHKVLQKFLNFPGGMQEFYTDYDVKDCIDLLHEAWVEITPFSIKNSWHTLLKGVYGSDPIIVPDEIIIPDQIGSHNLQKTIEAIKDENIAIVDVENWLSTMAKVEEDPEEDIEDNYKPTENTQLCSQDNLLLEKDEVERMFEQLILWSKDKPKFIQLQVQSLKAYCDQNE